MAGDRYAPRPEHEFTFGLLTVGKFERDRAERLFAQTFDRAELDSKGLKYERLDHLTTDILLGVD